MRAPRAVLCLGSLLALAFPRQGVQGKPEEFAAVDPYTRGAPKALERAGYVSLGPFPWLEGADTSVIEQLLGEPRILWVETAHFRLGSTLASYKSGVDKPEDLKLRAELERLSKKFERFEPEKNRLDPWLRLHLFAQRLEEQYAEFQKRFGFQDADFLPERQLGSVSPPWMGAGPHLGMELKPTVLLTEGNATLGRFMGQFLHETEACNWRGLARGGSMFLGQSAECLRNHGFELDAALHCAVAADLAYNLVDGFRGYHDSSPEWFKSALASWFSRRIDERWTIYARGTTFQVGDPSWKWAPRVRGLVTNGVALSWSKMLDWTSWEEIDAQGHMLAWSRLDWLFARKDADLHLFLMGMSEPVIPRPQQEACLRAAFGATLAELDLQWKDFVLKNAPRK